MFNNLSLEKKNWSHLKSWRPYFIILVIGFLLYSPSLGFYFTYLDDNVLILQHLHILEHFQNIIHLFSTDVFLSVVGSRFYYRPLLNLSFMFGAHWGGAQAYFYHLNNILLHLIASGLVFYLLSFSTRKRTLAFFLSLIFLVHPVLLQAVVWIPGRNNSLLAIFVFLAFLFFLKFLKQAKLFHYLFYLFFFFLALLTKESAIVLPLLIIFYFAFIDTGQSSRTDRWLLVFGSVAVDFFWFLMRSLALGSETINYSTTFWDTIHSWSAIFIYLGKLLFPIHLSVLPIIPDSTLVFGVITLILLAVAWIFSKQKRNNYLIFASLWFLLFLLPSFINFDGRPYFLEHRLYLPFFGFLLFLAELDWIKKLNFQKRQVQIAGLLILLILAGITIKHSQNFKNRLTFWESAVETSPHSSLAQKNLGAMYYFSGEYSRAIKHDQLALDLNSQEAMVHNNLGVIYMNQQKYSLAKKEFRIELKINPHYRPALNNLQILSQRQKLLK